jgi:hypothetical protein
MTSRRSEKPAVAGDTFEQLRRLHEHARLQLSPEERLQRLAAWVRGVCRFKSSRAAMEQLTSIPSRLSASSPNTTLSSLFGAPRRSW